MNSPLTFHSYLKPAASPEVLKMPLYYVSLGHSRSLHLFSMFFQYQWRYLLV